MRETIRPARNLLERATALREPKTIQGSARARNACWAGAQGARSAWTPRWSCWRAWPSGLVSLEIAESSCAPSSRRCGRGSSMGPSAPVPQGNCWTRRSLGLSESGTRSGSPARKWGISRCWLTLKTGPTRRLSTLARAETVHRRLGVARFTDVAAVSVGISGKTPVEELVAMCQERMSAASDRPRELAYLRSRARISVRAGRGRRRRQDDHGGCASRARRARRGTGTPSSRGRDVRLHRGFRGRHGESAAGHLRIGNGVHRATRVEVPTTMAGLDVRTFSSASRRGRPPQR